MPQPPRKRSELRTEPVAALPQRGRLTDVTGIRRHARRGGLQGEIRYRLTPGMSSEPERIYLTDTTVTDGLPPLYDRGGHGRVLPPADGYYGMRHGRMPAGEQPSDTGRDTEARRAGPAGRHQSGRGCGCQAVRRTVTGINPRRPSYKRLRERGYDQPCMIAGRVMTDSAGKSPAVSEAQGRQQHEKRRAISRRPHSQSRENQRHGRQRQAVPSQRSSASSQPPYPGESRDRQPPEQTTLTRTHVSQFNRKTARKLRVD